MDRVLPLGKHTAEFETMTSPEGLLVKTVNMNCSGQRHFNVIIDIDRETMKIHCNKIINKANPLRKKNTRDQKEATLSDSVCICFETLVNKNVRSHFLHSVVLSFLSIIKFCTHTETQCSSSVFLFLGLNLPRYLLIRTFLVYRMKYNGFFYYCIVIAQNVLLTLVIYRYCETLITFLQLCIPHCGEQCCGHREALDIRVLMVFSDNQYCPP